MGGYDYDVKQLIAAGARVRNQNSIALIITAQEGYDDVVEQLIAAGADVDAQDGMALFMLSRITETRSLRD